MSRTSLGWRLLLILNSAAVCSSMVLVGVLWLRRLLPAKPAFLDLSPDPPGNKP
jgi:hypothetical protein